MTEELLPPQGQPSLPPPEPQKLLIQGAISPTERQSIVDILGHQDTGLTQVQSTNRNVIIFRVPDSLSPLQAAEVTRLVAMVRSRFSQVLISGTLLNPQTSSPQPTSEPS